MGSEKSRGIISQKVTLRIGIVGGGNVGCELGRAMLRAGVNLTSVRGRSAEATQSLAQYLGVSQPQVDLSTQELPNIWIVTVPDRHIVQTCREYSNSGAIILHTSGSVPIPQSIRGERYGVLYPLYTFRKGHVAELFDVPFFLEATDSAVMELLHQLVQKLGGKAIEMDSEHRRLVHLMGVMASNFSVGLLDMTKRLADKLSISYRLVRPLMEATIQHAMESSPRDALTGPASRGDIETIGRQLSLLQETYPDIVPLYYAMTKYLTRISGQSLGELQKLEKELHVNGLTN